MWKPTSNSDFLMHYAKGQRAKNHKYITIKDGRYIYVTQGNHWKDNMSSGNSSTRKRGSHFGDHGGTTGGTKTVNSHGKSSTGALPSSPIVNKKGRAGSYRGAVNPSSNASLNNSRKKVKHREVAKANAGVNRSGGNAASAANAQNIKKSKKESQISRGLRKLSLNLKLLANKVPGVVPIRKAVKKRKKK